MCFGSNLIPVMTMNPTKTSSRGETRREFFKRTLAATATVAAADIGTGFSQAERARPLSSAGLPWYRRALRWAQTNITELDPTRYDIAWWRQHWKRTQVQGVIINAGGIFAYYPSRFPLHHRAAFLGERDLYGELARAAHEDGLAVLARMDSNRTHEDCYREHADWFAVDAMGRPYRAGELYVTCINGPYYDEFIPEVLREIIERSHPEGFTDNSWSGLGRSSICYCGNCTQKFRARTGQDLPRVKNWDDPVYRDWIRWNYARRLEVWDSNNRTTKAAGGPDCLWVGMNGGSVTSQSQEFRDYKAICERAEIIMLDHQARTDALGFQDNGAAGKVIHGLLGWNKLIPESMAMYQQGRPVFRLASKPEPEARLWVLEGFAAGIQPWWHHVGAYHEDRRMYRTIEPLNRWHRQNEAGLVSREPVAAVGILWSQQNTDFYGRDNPQELVDLPFRGFVSALIRARIPWLPVHADHIDRDASKLSVLVLPNLAVMSEGQCESVRRFVGRGGGLVATGESSLCNEAGELRMDFGLASIFGAHHSEDRPRTDWATRIRRATETNHTYLRLAPELRARVDGPKTGAEPAITGERHSVLHGFGETDILPFGGILDALETDTGCEVLATFIPAFPIFPPETAWMTVPSTKIPGLIARVTREGARVVFLAADLDRRFARDNLTDHGNLLANAVRWAAKDDLPLVVEGPGLVDCHLYRQADRLILHLVNLTNAGTWRAPVPELIPVGPLRVRVQLPAGMRSASVRSLVSGRRLSATIEHGQALFEVKSILDHEVVTIG
jgi:hypothetical protein